MGEGHELRCAGCRAAYPVADDIARLVPPEASAEASHSFYSREEPERYGRDRSSIPPAMAALVEAFVGALPAEAVVVEIGSGRGAFDRIHPGCIAADLSAVALRAYSTGPRVQADAQALPFRDGSLDAVFTVASLEHVPDPTAALAEIDRCLAAGGRALIYPAWYVRPWAARALKERPFADLRLTDRLSKATIPLRDRRPFWFAKLLPARLLRELALRLGHVVPFTYRRLDPDMERYLTSDSDAFSSMDPQAVAAYFLSRGYRDLNRASAWLRLLYGYEPVVVQKRRPSR